jgi:hypothetical protein
VSRIRIRISIPDPGEMGIRVDPDPKHCLQNIAGVDIKKNLSPLNQIFKLIPVTEKISILT